MVLVLQNSGSQGKKTDSALPPPYQWNIKGMSIIRLSVSGMQVLAVELQTCMTKECSAIDMINERWLCDGLATFGLCKRG